MEFPHHQHSHEQHSQRLEGEDDGSDMAFYIRQRLENVEWLQYGIEWLNSRGLLLGLVGVSCLIFLCMAGWGFSWVDIGAPFPVLTQTPTLMRTPGGGLCQIVPYNATTYQCDPLEGFGPGGNLLPSFSMAAAHNYTSVSQWMPEGYQFQCAIVNGGALQLPMRQTQVVHLVDAVTGADLGPRRVVVNVGVNDMVDVVLDAMMASLAIALCLLATLFLLVLLSRGTLKWSAGRERAWLVTFELLRRVCCVVPVAVFLLAMSGDSQYMDMTLMGVLCVASTTLRYNFHYSQERLIKQRTRPNGKQVEDESFARNEVTFYLAYILEITWHALLWTVLVNYGVNFPEVLLLYPAYTLRPNSTFMGMGLAYVTLDLVVCVMFGIALKAEYGRVLQWIGSQDSSKRVTSLERWPFAVSVLFDTCFIASVIASVLGALASTSVVTC